MNVPRYFIGQETTRKKKHSTCLQLCTEFCAMHMKCMHASHWNLWATHRLTHGFCKYHKSTETSAVSYAMKECDLPSGPLQLQTWNYQCWGNLKHLPAHPGQVMPSWLPQAHHYQMMALIQLGLRYLMMKGLASPLKMLSKNNEY